MQIHLTPESEKFIKSKVDSGEYESSSKVIEEALRVLAIRERKLQDLRKAIQEGLDSGPSTPMDIEDIIRRGHERLKTRVSESG
ncbi:MAG: type II toxin-antitoxin system ParD family antitoxin [SAR202 cluster bacterium]|nr:type II toxin-antitoxin system ParD family antitoxin [SAR202 cluster bacterium]